MPSLKDFIFSALGGKKEPVRDFGFRDSTNADYYAPRELEDFPDEATMRKIWLGTKTEPPSGTHISPVSKTPQWNNNDRAINITGYDFKDSSNRDQQTWKDAFAKIQEEYPYAAKNLDNLNYNPQDVDREGAAGFVEQNNPRAIWLNRARKVDDPYKTLLHELVHTNQMGAFPSPESFKEGPKAESIFTGQRPFRNFRVIEAPAYQTAGQGDKGSKIFQNYLKQRMKP